MANPVASSQIGKPWRIVRAIDAFFLALGRRARAMGSPKTVWNFDHDQRAHAFSVSSHRNHELGSILVRLVDGPPGAADLEIAPAQGTIDTDHREHHPRP
jgi:hypothetical protein